MVLWSLYVVWNKNYSSNPILLGEKKILGNPEFGMFTLRRVILAFYNSKKLQFLGLHNNNIPAGCFLAALLEIKNSKTLNSSQSSWRFIAICLQGCWSSFQIHKNCQVAQMRAQLDTKEIHLYRRIDVWIQAAGLFIEIISTQIELVGLDAWNAKWVNTSVRQKWVGADSEYSVLAIFRHIPPVHILERWKKKKNNSEASSQK